MKLWLTLAAASLLIAVPSRATAAPADEEPGSLFGDDLHSSAEVEDGSVTVGAGVVVAGDDGDDGRPGSEAPAVPQPDGSWITVSDIIYVTDPPCVVTYSEFLDGVDREDAERIEQEREDAFVAEYESHISGGSEPPPPCPRPDGDPGQPAIDPTPAIEFADTAEERLPVAAPSISGGYAITGLRSWVDLGRPSTFTATKELDLGPFSRTATLTARATTVVDWGDGTVTTHTTRGGGYHEGEPTGDDITHTYVDTSPATTLTVVDTWTITVTVAGLDDITLTWTAPAETITYPVREVRSARDD